ncbi:MAG: HNH endonuclease [Chloroflexi bacterium]|nr:MAG: HNH endonuclease [Chloroflexota bacterium]
MSVLLLNASYEPLQMITIRRAVNLMLAEKVQAVEGIASRLRTVNREFEVPSVVRLTYYVNVPRLGVTWSRRAVLERDGWQCIYCGVAIGGKKNGRLLNKYNFTIDHIIPKSRGGLNSWGNTACACSPCNNRKANRTPHEAGMKMLFEPKTPRGQVLVMRGQVPKEWVKYLNL